MKGIFLCEPGLAKVFNQEPLKRLKSIVGCVYGVRNPAKDMARGG